MEIGKKKIINLTPHEVAVYQNSEQTAYFDPSGNVARADVMQKISGYISQDDISVPLYRLDYKNLTGLPDPSRDTFYIVSAKTLMAAVALNRDTSDLFTPANILRDPYGFAIGCSGFFQN